MSGAQKAGVVVLGLVGLYLLSGRVGGGSGGGFGGGGGADREPSDTIINFPELDLSRLWGGQDTKKAAFDPLIRPDLEPSELWTAAEPYHGVRTADIGDWFRAQPESNIRRSNILNPQPMPYSVHDAPKKASYTHHGVSALPDPVSLGLTPKASYSGSGITTRHGSYVSPARIIKKQTISPTRDYGYGVSQYGGY